MQFIKKATLFAVLLALLCSLIPPTAPAASAASSTPVFELKTTTAVRAFIDVHLPFEKFKSGGPFTMTCEWKADFKPQIAVPSGKVSRAFILIIGTTYGTSNNQVNNELNAYESFDWRKVTMTFQNVGYYEVSGSQIPGNILRFKLNYSIGTVNFRNVLIKNAAGQVVYDINNDPEVQQLMGQMQDNGETSTDLTNLAAINFKTVIVSNQFELGNYTAKMLLGDSSDNNTTSKGPIFGSTTKPSTSSSTTKKPTTSSSTTKKPTTSSSTTKKPTVPSSTTKKPTTSQTPTTPSVEPGDCAAGNHSFVDGSCYYCGEKDPNFVPPCAHLFTDGVCSKCGKEDPNYVAPHQHVFANGKCSECGLTDPNYQPADGSDSAEKSDTGSDLIFWLCFGGVVLIFGGAMAVMVILANKKRNEE